jgi:hypothetical protein
MEQIIKNIKKNISEHYILMENIHFLNMLFVFVGLSTATVLIHDVYIIQIDSQVCNKNLFHLITFPTRMTT